MVYLFGFSMLVACCVAVSFWLEVREARALRGIVKHGSPHEAAGPPVRLDGSDEEIGDTAPSVLDMHEPERRAPLAAP